MHQPKKVSEKASAETMEEVLRAWVQYATTIPSQRIDTIDKLNAVCTESHARSSVREDHR
jgi:hypothetical protein